MDTFDSYRSSVPARMPAPRPGALGVRSPSGLPEATSTSPLSVRTILRGTRRYWFLVLMLWIVGSAGIGALVYMKVKPSYMAFSRIRIEPATNDLYGVRTNGETFETFMNTQVQLITSPNVLTAAGMNSKIVPLQRIQTAGDVVQELRKSVNVGVLPGTYLIDVSMTSADNHEAMLIVNAVVDAYLDTNDEWSNGTTRNQIKNLETYQRDLQNQIDYQETQWKELVAKGDVDANDAKKQNERRGEEDESRRSTISIEQYKQAQAKLNDITFELATAQAILETAKLAASRVSKNPSVVDDKSMMERRIVQKFRNDPEVAELGRQLLAAEKSVIEVERVSKDVTDPAVRKTRAKLDGLQKHYQDLWEGKSQSLREEFEQGGPGNLSPEMEVKEAQDKVNQLKASQTALRQTSKDIEVRVTKIAVDSVTIQLILDKRSSLKSMHEAVSRRLEQLKYESKGETRIRRVDPEGARLPTRAITDKRYVYMAATPIGVLGTVLGLVVLLEIRSGRVGDPDVLSSRVKHEVFSIAPLPNIRPGEDATGEKAEQKLARFVQSLDHLRVAICEGVNASGEGRCVMITSATGGEGKTTLSAHLAARCANSGTSTLLIDADMRRASLGRLLDVPVGPGLGDVLGGEIGLDESLTTVQAGGFHFLSAGTPGRDPSRVLKSARLSELIAQLRQNYDLIIIDTPPVLPVADALILGRWADGAIMAARFDASRLPLVERANRQLALAGIPVLGVVVNGVRGQDATYGNYAYSYNYYPGRSERPDASPSA